MNYSECSAREFTEALASKTSVPGGGGASALVGAIGIALGDMVGEFTVGKKTYAAVEEDVQALMKEAQKLRRSLVECVEKDAEAFEPLSKAYGIPKGEPGREEILEKCLADAAAVPFEILKLAARSIELEKDFAEKGSRMMTSDAATGAAMCRAALQGAAVNVKVNTKLMKNRAYAEKMNQETDDILEKYGKMAEEIFTVVYRKYDVVK